jgi:predicted nucleotidyltransferase
MNPWVERHSREILELAHKHGMTNVRVFGSMARGDAGETSDLDLLVDYVEGSMLFDPIVSSRSSRSGCTATCTSLRLDRCTGSSGTK